MPDAPREKAVTGPDVVGAYRVIGSLTEKKHPADGLTAHVQFGDGEYVCFDLEADPTWRTTTNDDAVIAREARAMLVWRMEHANRQNTGLLVEDGGVGRWPSGVQWRDNSPTN